MLLVRAYHPRLAFASRESGLGGANSELRDRARTRIRSWRTLRNAARNGFECRRVGAFAGPDPPPMHVACLPGGLPPPTDAPRSAAASARAAPIPDAEHGPARFDRERSIPANRRTLSTSADRVVLGEAPDLGDIPSGHGRGTARGVRHPSNRRTVAGRRRHAAIFGVATPRRGVIPVRSGTPPSPSQRPGARAGCESTPRRRSSSAFP